MQQCPTSSSSNRRRLSRPRAARYIFRKTQPLKRATFPKPSINISLSGVMKPKKNSGDAKLFGKLERAEMQVIAEAKEQLV